MFDGPHSAQMKLDLSKLVTKLADYKGIDVTISGNYDVTDDHRQKTNENERCRPSFTGNGTGKQTHAARQTSNRKSQSRTKSHDTDRRRADLR